MFLVPLMIEYQSQMLQSAKKISGPYFDDKETHKHITRINRFTLKILTNLVKKGSEKVSL